MRTIYKHSICFLFTGIFIFLSLKTYSQYLPLAGGTMTGGLNMSSGVQIQTSYLGFNNLFAQPTSAVNVAIFPNSFSSTLDIVGYFSGWRFIPNNSSSYSSPVVTIDQSGNTKIGGFTTIAGNLAIGSTTPASINGYSVFTLNNATNGGVIALQQNGATRGQFWADFNGANLLAATGLGLHLYSDNNEKLTILPAGNVGIGNVTPASRLEVGVPTGNGPSGTFHLNGSQA